MRQEIRDKALPTALSLYHRLKPFKLDLLYLQDAFTFYRPGPSAILYLVINIATLIVIRMELPFYSLLAIVIALCMVPGDVYLFAFHATCHGFKRPEGYVAPAYLNTSLMLPELCARLAVLYCVFRHMTEYVKNSLKSFSFVNVGTVTMLILAMFYATYRLGDSVISWIIVQLLFCVPLVITRGIGFKLINYPRDLETYVIAQMQPLINEPVTSTDDKKRDFITPLSYGW